MATVLPTPVLLMAFAPQMTQKNTVVLLTIRHWGGIVPDIIVTQPVTVAAVVELSAETEAVMEARRVRAALETAAVALALTLAVDIN